MSDVHCPSCDAEIPAGARFCVKCGTEAPADHSHDEPSAPAAQQTAAPTEQIATPAGGGSAATAPSGTPAATADAAATTEITAAAVGGPPPGAVPTQPTPAAPPGGLAGGVLPPPGAPGTPGAPIAPGGAFDATSPFPAAPPVAGGYQAPPTQFSPPAAPMPVSTKAPSSARNLIAGFIGLLAAVGFGLSTVLAWADIESFRGVSGAVVTGWDGLTGGIQDGLFFVLLALLAFIISATLLTGRATVLKKLALVATGLVGLAMTIFELATYSVDVDDINDLNAGLGISGGASVGPGLWLALIASIVLILAGVLVKNTGRKAKAGQEGVATPPATFGGPRAVGAVG